MTNSELIHNFTNNFTNCTTIEKRNMSVSLYKNKNEFLLYSYNTIIAIRDFKENVYKISNYNYSRTTGRHQSILRSAIHGYNFFYVYDVNNTDLENFKHELMILKDFANKHINAKSADYTNIIYDTLDNLNKMFKYLHTDKRKKDFKELLSILNLYNKEKNFLDILRLLVKLDEKKQEAVKAKKAKLLRVKKKEKSDFICILDNNKHIKFLRDYKKAYTDDDNNLYSKKRLYNSICDDIIKYNLSAKYIDFLSHKDLLKVTKNYNVVTSQGVTITKKEALLLYKLIINKKIKKDDTVLKWICKEINDIFIIVGCHTININDIKETYHILKGCKDV